ncbi:hypothetical protein [Marinigracilibium pacificum]|uniref:Uncharacterized protein n=1 Tax=Marinigracilibium pacificum TaxID=2729599 RepID=A0A848ITN4_9BACT|nr:hypothetical protein [Marinigracilibium pacificum]NMM47707.1 hypothetical protein [Marinigracilibium pacificum]
MEKENLTELIKGKWFDSFQSGLSSRFSANGMNYDYHYEQNNSLNSVIVCLSKGDVKTLIEFFENGNLDFYYSRNEDGQKKEFQNCSEDDFHTMLAHAFIYIIDGNFDYHNEWFSKLERRNTKHNRVDGREP